MAATTELKLVGKAPLARTLHLRANVGGHLTASLYLLSTKGLQKSMAFSVMKLADCYLSLGKYDNSAIWIGNTAFDVSETEAEEIRATYEPLGLHIAKEGAIELRSSADAAVHP